MHTFEAVLAYSPVGRDRVPWPFRSALIFYGQFFKGIIIVFRVAMPESKSNAVLCYQLQFSPLI